VRSFLISCNPICQFLLLLLLLLSAQLFSYPENNCCLFLYLQVFPYNGFKVSGLTLKSSIHFEEFFFVQGKRQGSNFSLLHVENQFFQHHLLKRLPFLQCMFWAPLLKIRWLQLCGVMSGSSILIHCSSCLLFLSMPCWFFLNVVV
jgi:hypothetical protein